MSRRLHRQLIFASSLVILLALAGCAGITMFDTVESLMREGRDLYSAKQYDQAIAKFEQVITQDNTYWMAYLYIARSYIAKGNWLPAIANARKAFQLAPAGENVVPTFAEALYGGGVDALRQAHFSDAIGHFVEYIRVKPTDASGYLNLGKAYLGNGAYGDALNAFLRGLGQGGDAAVQRNLVQGLFDGGIQAFSRGDAQGAIGFLQEYVKHDPGNLNAYLNLGRAFWQAGESGHAVGAFRRVLELSPGNSEALRFLMGIRP
ncbi:MAG TPA: tetratricopeptide repeat protein [Candidatus Methylomirabilis sp.]|nr:tetratricopeptide repeat protein [Candidatus Methylomirabilis sp.]